MSPSRRTRKPDGTADPTQVRAGTKVLTFLPADPAPVKRAVKRVVARNTPTQCVVELAGVPGLQRLRWGGTSWVPDGAL